MDSRLYQDTLQNRLGDLVDTIVVHDEIGSTNTEAMAFLDAGNRASRLIIARSQTAGRGRRGRQWISPPDSGIYMSLTRVLNAKISEIASLSLVTALAVWEALSELGAPQLQLKWPNDVLHSKGKLAGILLESRQMQTELAVVFGIGINLCVPAQEQATIDRKLANLNELLPQPVSPPELVATLVCRLYEAIEQFQLEGFRAFMQRWNSADRHLGQDVVIDNGQQKMIGKHAGVNESGALLLDTPLGREEISGGEVFPSLQSFISGSGDS